MCGQGDSNEMERKDHTLLGSLISQNVDVFEFRLSSG